MGPEAGTHHVLRGGSASVQASECRSAVRGEAYSDGPNPKAEQRYELIGDFGLRVVCEIGKNLDSSRGLLLKFKSNP
jgi:formylglycine-generating enzyme required for sulfatase activity